LQVSGLVLTTSLAVKIICHSNVTGIWRQRVTLRGPIWPL